MGMDRELIVFIDCGDTIVDESTQVFAENGDVLKADLIPGAGEMLRQLHGEGYRLALVADGQTASFHNIFRELGLSHIFEAWTISEEVGVCKPDGRMFRTAMEQMKLTEDDLYRIVMIGNNLKRDVLGANRMGITSILLSFSPRYEMQPAAEEEIPDYVAAMPCEIPELIHRLELQVKNRRIPILPNAGNMAF
jgi:putative hydrolase of the HAD superfamily